MAEEIETGAAPAPGGEALAAQIALEAGAQKQFAIATGLDLSAAEKSELARVSHG